MSPEASGEAAGPGSVVAEEERLKEERLRTQAEAAPPAEDAPPAGEALGSKKMKQLDTLLDQANLYTQFLSEQMVAIQEKEGGEAGVEGNESPGAAAGGGAGRRGKRAGGTTRGGSGSPGAKRAKKGGGSPAPSATKEFLGLFEGELRDYQLKGVKWLISLWQNGLNGILADQMGLGKTVQAVGFLSHLREKGVLGPYLVVGPLSTLPNWVKEFERFCPSMPCVLYHGSQADRQDIRASRMPTGPVSEKFPVIITSYEILMRDRIYLQNYRFKYVVVDEGHRLKNFDCRLIRELKTIPTENKLLLTGTPLQNNLAELWSLLNFLLPDIFTSLTDFESWFDFSNIGESGADAEIVAQEQHNRVVSKLHNILKPFVLRRVKADVETSLPNKKEIILYADMSPLQKKVNQQLMDKTLKDTMQKVNRQSGGGTADVGNLSNMLMQMRKNCNHPDLIMGPFDGSTTFPEPEELIEQCGKFRLMDRILTQLRKKKHKVLFFSQMTKMLDLIESFLTVQGHRVCRIDGGVPWQERQAAIEDFNHEPDVQYFLLSTRAGGLGINLTAADTVIIYDSDWNPHQDMQAMDRCHRIGQTKPVLVFRLATGNSVEGKMLRKAQSKLLLERVVMKKGAFLQEKAEEKRTSMNSDELLDLLQSDISKDDVAQSGVISDKDLLRLLDRSGLESGKPFKGEMGKGFEVIPQKDGSSLLKGIQ